jgi:hypothetical protein
VRNIFSEEETKKRRAAIHQEQLGIMLMRRVKEMKAPCISNEDMLGDRMYCPHGHEIVSDDPTWCPSCNGPVRPLRPEFLDGFDQRTQSLLYGDNPDSILDNSEGQDGDNNMSAAEEVRGINYWH